MDVLCLQSFRENANLSALTLIYVALLIGTLANPRRGVWRARRAELVEHAVPPEMDIQVLGRDAMEAIHPAFEAVERPLRIDVFRSSDPGRWSAFSLAQALSCVTGRVG